MEFLFHLILGIGAALLGFWIGYLWRSGYISSLLTSINDWESKYDGLYGDFSKSKKMHKDLDQKYALLSTEKNKMENELNDWSHRFKTKEEEYTTLNLKFDTINSDFGIAKGDWQTRSKEWEGEKAEWNSKVESAEKEKDEWKMKWETSNKEGAEWKSKWEASSEWEKKFKDLETELHGKESELTNLRGEVGQLNGKYDTLNIQFQEASKHEKTVQEWRTKHDDLLIKWNAQKTRSDELSNELENQSAEIGELRNELAKKPKEVEVIKEVEIIKEVEVVKEVPIAAPNAVKSKKDDLKRIEGIGPKIEGLLNQDGIFTWSSLADTEVAELKGILDAAGPRYQMHDPQTWPLQGRMAANGEWEKLDKWQDLHGRKDPKTSSKKSKVKNMKAASSKAEITRKDDLKKVEGIGPKIEQLLNADGIYTWNKLSKTPVANISEILEKAGPRYQMHHPGSWPKQAGLAADGKWEALEKLQDELDGGR